MKYLLLHPRSFSTAPIAEALAAEGVETRATNSASDLNVSDSPTALIIDHSSRATYFGNPLRGFVDSGGTCIVLGAPGETEVPSELDDSLVAAYVPQPSSSRQLLISLRTAFREVLARAETARARSEAAMRAKEIGKLTRIGVALATERDYNALLDLILSQARRITASDAGSLYLVETLENEAKRLRFKLTENYSHPEIPFVEYTIPIDHASIAGYVASTGEPLVIDDVYFLAPDVEYSFNRAFDEKYGYRTKSMLAIPMKNHKEEVIGVLQMINRKRDGEAVLQSPESFNEQVTPYSPRSVELVSSLAGQAAVSIENGQLYESIERLFEGFVRASVTAIEQRDPTTFGHSGRVASMTVGLAETVNRASQGAYRNFNFSHKQIKEIRYAALLHDFGKVGVREQVLVKAKKLYPPDLTLIKQRYAFIKRSAERDFYRQRVEYLEERGMDGYEEYVKRLEAEHQKQLESLERFMQLVAESNEPTVLPEGSFEELLRYSDVNYQDLAGKKQPYLSDDEVRFLTIRKGSLDESERLEIEGHVAHTYRFLMQIPWTRELQEIPMIAYGHHEKLNATGYPRSIGGDQIPVQTRMMTISDIFDALTASDRPYKRAVPMERALDIMAEEVAGEMLDPDLFELFAEAHIFEHPSEDS